jgi:hypothetical protein
MAATLAVLICILIPALRRKKSEVCRNNLRNVGVAFRIWPANGDSFPMHTDVAYGGTRELINSGQAFVHFQVMSNELTDGPRLLVCPLDEAKRPAKDFGPGFSDTNVSYFVGGDAADVLPQALLSGDRNFAVRGAPVNPGVFILTTNTPLEWTKAIHHSCGYILLADGSVQFFDSSMLAAAVRNQGIATNKLAVP